MRSGIGRVAARQGAPPDGGQILVRSCRVEEERRAFGGSGRRLRARVGEVRADRQGGTRGASGARTRQTSFALVRK
jgi:hypothetical protein